MRFSPSSSDSCRFQCGHVTCCRKLTNLLHAPSLVSPQDCGSRRIQVGRNRHRCSGRLEVKSNNSWSSVCEDDFDLLDAEVVCGELGCGAPSVLQGALYGEAEAPILSREFLCEGHESVLLDCGSSWRKTKACPPDKAVGLTCSDSVRLENGSSRCSGRLEVKSNNSWSSVCEDDFDLLDAEVVCRELGCGAPSVLQGALYGEAEAPTLRREFLCEGHESVLLDCGSSWRKTKACPPDKAVGLTCSDPVTMRLMGSSRCSGELQVKIGGEWRAVDAERFLRTETTSASVCKNLKCGSHVSSTTKQLPREKTVFRIRSSCFHIFPLNMEECLYENTMGNRTLEITCLDSVRLEDGSSRCSGRLEVKSNNWWSSVCEDDFDLLDAEVVCRELGCGAPSVLQGALYGEAEAPILSREFLCEGHESVLLDCGSSWRKTKVCPPDKAVGLTCSGTAANSVRLENGSSRCSGRLEVKSNNWWSSVCEDDFDLLDAEVVCRELGCGAPSVLQGALYGEAEAPILSREFLCEGHESVLLDCGSSWRKTKACPPDKAVGLTCSDSVRLENGSSRCSGRLEVKSNNWWSSVCEDDFDLLDAEVVCRELGCGAPSVLQGALYGEAEAPKWNKEFLCKGHESSLLDCNHARLERSSSSDKVVDLTCSGGGGATALNCHCAGTLEMFYGGDWGPVAASNWNDFDLLDAEVVCRELGCGAPSVLQGALYGEAEAPILSREFLCEGHESVLLDCGSSWRKTKACPPDKAVGLTCSDSVRLENGSSRCSGRLEVKSNNSWSSVCEDDFDLLDAEVVCRELGCGAPSVLQGALYGEAEAPILSREFLCEGHESVLLDCGSSWRKTKAYSVRLENGSSRCSGRLEVKSNNSWSSVCEDDFDLLDAEVVCRELGCGAPSVLQGALYGEAEAPILSREFLCEGHESVLLDCGSSWRKTKACPPDKAVGLTCSGTAQKSSVSVSVVGLMIRWVVVSVGLTLMILVTCFYATVLNTQPARQIQDLKYFIVMVNCCLLENQTENTRGTETFLMVLVLEAVQRRGLQCEGKNEQSRLQL
uniref:SRCR domain-containing protein n=1 Tax=Oryzias latipes TaxID=8090 RepID=A0A3B3HIA7_ORYLA